MKKASTPLEEGGALQEKNRPAPGDCGSSSPPEALFSLLSYPGCMSQPATATHSTGGFFIFVMWLFIIEGVFKPCPWLQDTS